MRRRTRIALAALVASALLAADAGGYPLDGYPYTGINRLLAYDRAREALLARGTLAPGSLRETESVVPRLVDQAEFDLPEPDVEFSRQLRALLGGQADRYGVAILDWSDPPHTFYAEHNGRLPQIPGSVGKTIVGIGWFQALADAYPDDVAARERVLRESEIVAGDFINNDHHIVPIWKPGDELVRKRPLQEGDSANMWSWLDWMLSASSNAAASTVMEQLMLFRADPTSFPPSADARRAYFADTPRAELAEALRSAVVEPLVRNGLDPERLRQASFFTKVGKQRVPGSGSTATARELARFLLRLEQGRIVDEWSSRELKRLIYLTDRRVRYASHPALSDAAVYFKSGSIYGCKPEPDFVCEKYRGNRINYMNSIAIVESEHEGRRLHYGVALLSNVLRENSAVAHQTLAMRIHRLIEARNGASAPATPVPAGEPAESAPAAPEGASADLP